MRIIDADRYQKDLLSAYDDLSMELEVLDRQPLVSAIPIRDKMTNRDVIKAMFPNEEIIESDYACVYVGVKMRFDKDWWNAPYTLEREV